MKAYTLVEVLDAADWLDSLELFNPRRIFPRIHWVGFWVGPRDGVEAV
jgi:hypothetical protein